MKKIMNLLMIILLMSLGVLVYQFSLKYLYENKMLKEMISRLEADSRIAEVIVKDVKYDKEKDKTFTTIKFLEYDTRGNPLQPKYFIFTGNIIQFQSLVIRFDDLHVKQADPLKGKSAYLFWKVFVLDGQNTKEYEITKLYSVPEGYKAENDTEGFQAGLWQKFWDYALDPEKSKKIGIKNAQIEAPGTKFIPGLIYTIKIEHDGGMRIDSSKIPEILKGERLP